MRSVKYVYVFLYIGTDFNIQIYMAFQLYVLFIYLFFFIFWPHDLSYVTIYELKVVNVSLMAETCAKSISVGELVSEKDGWEFFLATSW